MRISSLPVILIMVVLLSGCASPNCVKGWEKIKVGMSQKQVVKSLGEPTVTMPPVPVAPPTSGITSPLDLFRERWMYVERGPAVSEKLMFLLYFDMNGRLVSYRPPLEGPYKEFQANGQDVSK